MLIYRWRKLLKSTVLPVCTAVVVAAGMSADVYASKVTDLQAQQSQTQSQLNSAQHKTDSLENQQASLSSEMDEANNSIVQNMASIQLLEERISDLNTQIAEKQAEYDQAKQDEETQYEAMKRRIKFMYEKGDANYVQLMLQASSFSDMVNKADYVQELYEYDRKLLLEYQDTQARVAQAQAELEDEKSSQEESKDGLEEEQAALQEKLDALQDQYDNVQDQIAEAQAEAASLAAQIKQQNREISAAVEEEARIAEQARLAAAAQAAAAADAAGTAASTTTDSSAAASSESSDTASSESKPQTVAVSPSGKTGRDVANYACQFVGNPYVYGGTSLTNGTDCSGFTMSVYKAFGYSIPRTAESQRSAGVGVASLAEAQPGDIICYAGHVGLYIGNGTIVHASTAATGIKYSVATYRDIICIRRIIN